MRKSIYSEQQKWLNELLRQERRRAGLTQAELAEAIGKDQTFVSKYESGERRLDVLELREICLALGLNLGAFIRKLERALQRDP